MVSPLAMEVAVDCEGVRGEGVWRWGWMRESSCASEAQLGVTLGHCLTAPTELWREKIMKSDKISHNKINNEKH